MSGQELGKEYEEKETVLGRGDMDGYEEPEAEEAEGVDGETEEGQKEVQGVGSGEGDQSSQIQELRRQLEQQQQMFNYLLSQSQEGGGQTRARQSGYAETARQEPEIGYDDLDWEDPEDLKKKLPQLIQGQTAQAIQQLQQQMQQGQQMVAYREAQRNQENLRNKLEQAGMSELFGEVQQKIQEWRLSPEQLADPNVYDETVAYILGKREYRKLMSQGKRPPNLGGSGPAETSQPRQRRSSLTEDDQRVLESLTGGKVSPDDIDFFNNRAGAGPVSYDDWMAHEQSKKKKKRS